MSKPKPGTKQKTPPRSVIFVAPPATRDHWQKTIARLQERNPHLRVAGLVELMLDAVDRAETTCTSPS